jgi:2-dehydro-3-deoxygluconokinase
MERLRVACIGEALAVLIPTQPGPLEAARTFSWSVGGAELNVAFALEACRVHSALLTRVGDDGFGRRIISDAIAHGLDVTGVATDESRSTGMYIKELGGVTGKETDIGAEHSRMHYYRAGSAGSALEPSYLEDAHVRGVLDTVDMVHLTGITPALSDTSARLADELWSTSARWLKSFDVNWRPALWRGREREGAAMLARLVHQSDIAFLGATEALIVAGTTDPTALRRAFPEPRYLVVKNDGNAATGFDGHDRSDVHPTPTEVLEAIGAGDAFAAGFLNSVLEGDPIEANLRAGHALASRALRSLGDTVSF